MAESRKIVRVFLASPGDLQEERGAAKRAVNELNFVYLPRLGYQIELVGWELTTPGFGRPQALINKELDTCEFFLGVVYKRWGMPPDIKGEYTSGFEEEFRRSVKRRGESQQPQISLLFKRLSPDDRVDPGDQLKRVLAFREEIAIRKELLYQEFDDIENFLFKVRATLMNYVHELADAEAKDREGQLHGGESAPSTGVTRKERLPAKDLNNQKIASFLQKMSLLIDNSESEITYTSADAARLRIASASLGISGNDLPTIGTHDANLLYQASDQIDLTDLERTHLILNSLRQFEQEVMPLWHWLAERLGTSFLATMAFAFSDEGTRSGVLKVMEDTEEGIPEGVPIPRAALVAEWLGEANSAETKSAALSYLERCGIAEDLPLITAERERNDPNTFVSAVSAIVAIRKRSYTEHVLEYLMREQVDQIDKAIVSSIFEDENSIESNLLIRVLRAQSGELRKAALDVLVKRRALSLDLAQELLSDADFDVRLEGMLFLTQNGRAFSEPEAKSLLLKDRGALGISLYGSLTKDDSYYRKFSRRQLERSSDSDLRTGIEIGLYGPDEEILLARRNMRRYGEKLRLAIRNRFADEFQRDHGGTAINTASAIARLGRTAFEETTRRAWTRAALDVVCELGERRDLELVRDTLSSGSVGVNDGDYRFLMRHGDFFDVELIIRLADGRIVRREGASGWSGLLYSDVKDFDAAAAALYKLGSGRAVDVAGMEMSADLLVAFLLQFRKERFRSLGVNVILKLLRHDDANVRKAAALQCALSLPKRGLKAIPFI